MKLRNLMNLSGGMGFVKKSAELSSVRTNGTTSSPSSTMSRTKKCLRFTCFDLEWNSGLYERSRADLLSVDVEVGLVT